jgi:hypothetical protein
VYVSPPISSSTEASSASPFIVTSSLPSAAMMVCRRDVRFVAFSPVRMVTPGVNWTDVSSMPPMFSAFSEAGFSFCVLI